MHRPVLRQSTAGNHAMKPGRHIMKTMGREFGEDADGDTASDTLPA